MSVCTSLVQDQQKQGWLLFVYKHDLSRAASFCDSFRGILHNIRHDDVTKCDS